MRTSFPAALAILLGLVVSLASCKQRPERGASTTNFSGSVMQDTDEGINNPAYTHGDVPSNAGLGKNGEPGAIADHRAKADINRMGVRDFMILGLSQEDASRVVAYRSEHGAFHSVDDLLKVPGVHPGWFNRVHNELVAGGGGSSARGTG